MISFVSAFMKRRLWFKVVLGTGFLLGLLAAVAWFLPQQVLTVDSGPVKADVMVVLGGTTDRAGRAAELFKAGEASKIIVSGFGDCATNERLLKNAGVSIANIILEAKSRTTRENAEYSISLLRQMSAHRVIIVTTWYHSRRALACFEHYAPEIQFYSRPSYFGYVGKARDGKTGPSPVLSPVEAERLQASRKAEWKRVRIYTDAEYVKLLGYWVCYGVCPI
jgi:uncharacterized SAM-binding protein YcdF (DUF218 family)